MHPVVRFLLQPQRQLLILCHGQASPPSVIQGVGILHLPLSCRTSHTFNPDGHQGRPVPSALNRQRRSASSPVGRASPRQVCPQSPPSCFAEFPRLTSGVLGIRFAPVRGSSCPSDRARHVTVCASQGPGAVGLRNGSCALSTDIPSAAVSAAIGSCASHGVDASAMAACKRCPPERYQRPCTPERASAPGRRGSLGSWPRSRLLPTWAQAPARGDGHQRSARVHATLMLSLARES
jgi:hypothetical protein